MVYIAVYGTLKIGNYNHEIYLNKKPNMAGRYKIPAKMYSNGRYPMLIKSELKHSIYLEIYSVSEKKLQEIDDLEEPFNYHREKIEINNLPVWIYYYTPNNPPDEFYAIPNGNFRKEEEL